MKYTNTPYYAWIFTDKTILSNPYLIFQGANSIKLTANYARFRDTKALYNAGNACFMKFLIIVIQAVKFDSSPPKFPYMRTSPLFKF